MTNTATFSQFGSGTHISLFRSLRSQLILLFLAVSLIPLITVTLLIDYQAQNALKTEVINKLIAVRDIKANQIAKYFEERLGDVKVLSQNSSTVAAIRAFDKAVEASMKDLDTKEAGAINHYRSLYVGKPEFANAEDGSAYSAAHAQYHPMFKAYKEVYGYYDIFLVEPHAGNIVYSVMKEDDFGTSLKSGPYVGTNIGHVFQQSVVATERDFTWLEDFAYYEPSKEAASFVASPIFDDSKLIGVLIFQLPTALIDAIMQEHTGLGETGETLLVSSDDFLLRSNSRFFEESTLFKQKVDNEATRASAAGIAGVKEILDYRGEPAIIAHTPLKISGVRWSLNAKIDEAEAFAAAYQMLNLMLTISGIGAVIVLGIAFFVSNSITKPVRAMTQIARQLAGGDLNLTVDINRQDEIGVMANAYRQMIANLRQVIDDIVQVSQGLAKGRLSVTPQSEYRGDFVQIKNALETALSNQRQVIEDIVQVSQGLAQGILSISSQAEYQGDFVQIKDALETALTDLRRVIEDIVQVSQGLAEGHQNITPQAYYRGDFVQIKNALETAAVKLAATTKQNASQDWLKTGQNQLNDQMSGEPNLVELTYNIVSFLTLYLEAQIGLCYLVEESANHHNRRLKLTASYAQARRKNLADEFEFSEGLVGRAAREQKSLLITIDAGLEEETVPRHLIVIPFLYENTVKGVVLIASSEVLTEIQRDFIHQVMPSIGIAVNSVESRTKMQELLQQTQIQAQELQSQQEELQQSNEELQSQSEELQTQSEELQSQAEELRQTNEALEARTQALERQQDDIREKNLALEKTQQAMAAKAQELELASKYKSEFLANMSHELRTPLNSLLILAQLLADNKKGNLTDKQVEYARTIHSAGSDLLTLINDILDLSKVEAGKLEVHLDDVPLLDLVAILEQKFRHVAEEKGLTFNLMVAENLPPFVKTDVQKLHQIINNLLSNAFKFTSEGEVKVTVQRPKSPQWPISLLPPLSQNFIAISVTDTGIGIPKEKQQVIFEAFQQVDGTTSRRYGGTGLGLSISRQLARLLGGEIELHSEEGKGSTFTLYLPETLETRNSGVNGFTSFGVQQFSLSGGKDSEASVASHDGLTPRTAGERIETPLFQKTGFLEKTEDIADIADDRETLKPEDKSILIVEDDRKFSNILMEIAREKNFKCIIAEDGRTGLHLAEQYKPNAIILDIGLPQLDGWTVMERLKDNPDTRHIPVHFMSASDQSMDAKKMGAIGYLLKPASMEQLGTAFHSIEQFLAQTVKNVLVVADNEPRQQNILDLVKGENIQITLAITKAVALEHLQMRSFDCVILDMDIEQKSGCQLLEQMQNQEGLCQIPLIVYADHELTTSEETLLQQCADSLPVKSVRSPERLLDEATLFLHQIAANLPKEKRNMLRMVHDKAAILRKKRVLIVDDDVRNVFALATVLEDKDMEVVCAQNGYEALALLETYEDIALILMDIMMPEMDGYEAMREIRKQPRYRQLPIIALTAKAMKGDKAKCIEAGANDYLSKPVDTDKLISLMRVWLYR